ncbi:MAG: hypothetical protein IJZ29_04345 [Clostridia bacterium]|nr:hypothetical protein [Clostridia bacterium]
MKVNVEKIKSIPKRKKKKNCTRIYGVEYQYNPYDAEFRASTKFKEMKEMYDRCKGRMTKGDSLVLGYTDVDNAKITSEDDLGQLYHDCGYNPIYSNFKK